MDQKRFCGQPPSQFLASSIPIPMFLQDIKDFFGCYNILLVLETMPEKSCLSQMKTKRNFLQQQKNVMEEIYSVFQNSICIVMTDIYLCTRGQIFFLRKGK